MTPQTRMTIAPRLDYTINDKNTLVARYQNTRIGQDDNGVGGYNLLSQAYNTTNQENTVQLTETMVISPKAINETRFQYQHVTSNNIAAERHAADQCAGIVRQRRVGAGQLRQHAK